MIDNHLFSTGETQVLVLRRNSSKKPINCCEWKRSSAQKTDCGASRRFKFNPTAVRCRAFQDDVYFPQLICRKQGNLMLICPRCPTGCHC